MSHTKIAFLVLAALALASCTTTVPARGPSTAAPDDELGLPPVQGALEFPPGATEVTHGWLVDELARLTGQELSLSPGVRADLDRSKERLELTTTVPADHVYTYIEALLARHLVIAPITGGEHPVLGLYGLNEGPGRGAAPKPVVIDVEQAAVLERHPALYFQFVMTFQNVDTRQLQTQLRQLLVDTTGLNQVIPAGDRCLLLQGPGARLASLSKTLLEVDRASQARPAAEPAQPAPR